MLTPNNNLLTINGWKNITELEVGEEILTTNFAGHGIFSPVLNITKYDYDGYIYEHNNPSHNRATGHFSLTAGSVVPLSITWQPVSIKDGKRRLMEKLINHTVEEMAASKKNLRPLLSSPLQYNVDSKRHRTGIIRHGAINMSDVDYFRFLAYVIFRTSIVKGSGQRDSLVPKIGIRLRDDPTAIMELLDKYNVPYRLEIALRNNRPDIGRRLVLRHGVAATRSLQRIIGKKRISKRLLPDVIMRCASPEAIHAFLLEVVRINKSGIDLSDGRLPSKATNFTVSTVALAEQLAELFHKIGYYAVVNEGKVGQSVTSFIQLTIRPVVSSTMKPNDIVRREYIGEVYTIDVINEMAVVNPTNLGPRNAMVVKVN